MADILLFGPQGAGKTQLYYSLRRLNYNKAEETGLEDYKVQKPGLFSWFRRRITIHEMGGKKLWLNQESLRQAFKSHSKLVFVFNGNELIKEMENYKEGGYISSLIRCYVMPALEKTKISNAPQVVTINDDSETMSGDERHVTRNDKSNGDSHKDKYDRKERDMEAKLSKESKDRKNDIFFIATHVDKFDRKGRDMAAEIYHYLETANDEYCKVANGTRYTFKELLIGNLFCLDARDSKEVGDRFKDIIKE
ncbi:MAG: hypothetical protein IKN31_01175 [Bacteroidales bacterium]|nr:hypothetical protein [Bacteroidales bacterium]